MTDRNSDTYRAGDPDFDWVRERFYAMVRRHLSFVVSPPPPPPREKKKLKKAVVSSVTKGERDGRPFEIERYGDPAKIMYRDNASSALGWLMYNGHLNSRIDGERTEKALENAWNEGRGRINTATKLDDIFERAELTPLRSPDFEAIPGGSFGPREIGFNRLRCIRIIGQIEGDIPPESMRILREIICENKFIWYGLNKKATREVMESIRMAFDFAAWSLDRHRLNPEMTKEELVRRWPAAHDWFTTRRLQGSTISCEKNGPSSARR